MAAKTLGERIEQVLCDCTHEDWVWDGEDETPVYEFDEKSALDELLKIPLIAAAPELLEALERIYNDPHGDVWEGVEAIIAKAKGESI